MKIVFFRKLNVIYDRKPMMRCTSIIRNNSINFRKYKMNSEQVNFPSQTWTLFVSKFIKSKVRCTRSERQDSPNDDKNCSMLGYNLLFSPQFPFELKFLLQENHTVWQFTSTDRNNEEIIFLIIFHFPEIKQG